MAICDFCSATVEDAELNRCEGAEFDPEEDRWEECGAEGCSNCVAWRQFNDNILYDRLLCFNCWGGDPNEEDER